MATDKSFMEYAADQMRGAGDVSYRKMFGEYGVYCDGKFVALVCDNNLFVKETDAGRKYYSDTGATVAEGFPYTGAKPAFLIDEKLDDGDWVAGLVRVTYDALPEPKPKKGTKP